MNQTIKLFGEHPTETEFYKAKVRQIAREILDVADAQKLPIEEVVASTIAGTSYLALQHGEGARKVVNDAYAIVEAYREIIMRQILTGGIPIHECERFQQTQTVAGNVAGSERDQHGADCGFASNASHEPPIN